MEILNAYHFRKTIYKYNWTGSGGKSKNDDITNNLSSIHKKIKNISNVVETMTFNNGAYPNVTG